MAVRLPEVTITPAVSGGITIAQPDVTLMLDLHGIIQDVHLSNAVSNEPVRDWLGRPWVETVGDTGSGKILRMVEDARQGGVSAFRQVTQRFPSGLELPMEYTTVRLGGKAGLIAIGRNLQAIAELQTRLIAAQQAMEQEYWKLREVETRYRMLFDASNEAVLLLRADSLQIVEANPSAIRLLGLARGRDLLAELAADEREPFQGMLQRVRQNGRAPGVLIHLGADRLAWLVRASLMTSDPGPMFMVQLAPAASAGSAPRSADAASLDEFIDRMPDAFVVIDQDGTLLRGNRAFLDLVQASTENMVLGERLSRWLSRPGADMTVLLANVRRHGSVRLFATGVQGELGTETAVEISAVGNAAAASSHIGLLIRDVGRRLSRTDEAAGLQAAFATIIEHSGKAPLRSLVRDTVGLVERHYIGAALELAGGNRTVAAELLGLSRQGFYKKLAQYGVESEPRDGAIPTG
jgi:transcriptional regulator PpsR